jgi:UDPglucose 6-dehydrogenase
VICYDPEAMPNTIEYVNATMPELKPLISFGSTAYDILKDADALAVCTEWSIFRTPEWDRVKAQMQRHVVFDGRNLFDVHEMKEQGFYYNSMGRTTIHSSI